MRLTLRNLLAYMHHMMTPEDQASFQTLLQASPRAQALLTRCQDVARQRKLAALSIEQPCERHSAVAVSNYLDHQMQDQHLGSFEHSALHSDEQLAEIVDCHRVIADIVAHRVHVHSPPWKERLRLLARQHNVHVPAPPSAEHAGATTAESDAPLFAEHEYKLCSMMDIAKVERAVEETLLYDSDDLTKQIADEEELSECAARQRDRLRQKQANAGLRCGQETRPAPKYAWPQQASATPVAQQEAEQQQTDVQPKVRYELAVPLPLLVGGLGGLLLIGGVVWLCW